MTLALTHNWLIIFTSIIFWLAPVGLAINLALIQNKSNQVKKKTAYLYGLIWVLAFIIYCARFLSPG